MSSTLGRCARRISSRAEIFWNLYRPLFAASSFANDWFARARTVPTPAAASHFRLVIFSMLVTQPLRILVVIDDVGLHLPEQHHRVVLVYGVVTVHWVVSREVAEAEEERVRFVELEPGHVFARHLHYRHAVRVDPAIHPRPAAVSVSTVSSRALPFMPAVKATRQPAQDLMFLEVDVNGMLPVAARIDKRPVFGAVLRHGEAEDVAVGKLIIDDPLAVLAVKDEVARNPRSHDAGQLVEGWPGRRINAAIADGGANPELEGIGTRAGSQEIAGRSLPVFLFQAVLQPDRAVAA